MPRRAALRVRGAPGQPRFVSYYRVSTAQQGASGLGLEAQREAVSRHVAGAQGVIVAEFQEVESGKKNDRPQIAAALAACRLRHATLVIAKLDRLARNVHFISSLMELGVDFVACDNPHATRLTIHILAAVAEHEREMISQRTIAALGRRQGARRQARQPEPAARRQPGSADRAAGAHRIRRRACRRRPALYRARPQSRLRLIGRARPRAFRLRHPHAGRRPRMARLPGRAGAGARRAKARKQLMTYGEKAVGLTSTRRATQRCTKSSAVRADHRPLQ